MKRGNLVISLDFELIWGVFDKVNHKEKEQYFNNTQKLIPEILKLFGDYDIHATWATVGMLFNQNWDEWMNNIPDLLPEYDNARLSAYNYGLKNRTLIDNNLCFAGELIDSILSSGGQELGTHTYSHYYCLEKGQSVSSFNADMKMALKLAKNRNVQIKSLVFPRNQFNSDYLKVCNDLGITGVRVNPDNWYWKNTQKDTIQQKMFRTGDAYLGFNDKPYDLKIEEQKFPVQQKASRLLRPKEATLRNKLKLRRICNEIDHAAKSGKVYHLWWHPHNFGADPQANLSDLKYILDFYAVRREKFLMKSSNMQEITEFVTGRNKKC